MNKLFIWRRTLGNVWFKHIAGPYYYLQYLRHLGKTVGMSYELFINEVVCRRGCNPDLFMTTVRSYNINIRKDLEELALLKLAESRDRVKAARVSHKDAWEDKDD